MGNEGGGINQRCIVTLQALHAVAQMVWIDGIGRSMHFIDGFPLSSRY